MVICGTAASNSPTAVYFELVGLSPGCIFDAYIVPRRLAFVAGGEHCVTFKYWQNGKPHKLMYLFEGTRDFCTNKHLKAGCHLAFYCTPAGRIVSTSLQAWLTASSCTSTG